uniref:G domain-containing protein n=1 Tax=Globodera pallida TaxID=36090 RepID=A0A183C162_GLOPA
MIFSCISADVVFLKDAIGLDSAVGTRQNREPSPSVASTCRRERQQHSNSSTGATNSRRDLLEQTSPKSISKRHFHFPSLSSNSNGRKILKWHRKEYEFHTGGEGSSAAGANDNPTVGQMAQEMLSDELDMPMERLMEQFEVQLQIRDSDMEPVTVFVDMNKRRWRDTPIEHRGHYKAILHPKTSSPISNNGHLTQSHKCFDSEQQRLITLADEKVPKRGQSKNMGDVGQPQRLREDTDNWKTKPERLREDTDNWETKPERLREDTDNWETKERFYLSENGNLGNLYDAHTDNFVNCHDLGFMRNIVAMRTQTEQSRPTTRERSIIEVDQLGSLDERLQMLGMEQKLSVISRLADFGGDSPLGQFLMAASQSDGFDSTNSFGIIHIVPKKLTLIRLRKAPMASLDSAILSSLNKFVRIRVFVNPSVRIVGTDLTFTSGLDLFADVPQQAASINHGIGHPITFSLMPLSAIVDKSKEPTLLPILPLLSGSNRMCKLWTSSRMSCGKPRNEDQWNSARQLCQRFVMLKNSFAVLLRNCVVDLRMGAVENEMNGGEFVAGGQPMDALEETVGIFEECSQHLIELCDSITNRKVELIRQLEAKGILYVGRGNRHLPDVLMDHEESHKMPSLHFVLFFYPPETPPDETSPDLEQFYWQCLGQLFQMADRGKSCVFVDLELLLDGEHSATEVPEGIRSMDGFPKIGARLVKLRGEQLLTADCVAEETRKLELCIARIKNLERTDIGVERPSDRRVLPCSLPCPLCKNFGGRCPNSDFLWGCDDCGQTLTFVKQPKAPITHFFCACGRTPADEFAFRCADIKTHGYSFKHFTSKSLMDKELDRLNNRGDVNILLLGETGGGKSTLINALVNYLKHATMEDALGENNIDWLIPARFSTEEYDSSGYSMPKDVFVGEMTKDECLLPGKSQTKFPKAYIIPSKDGNKIRLIDAPGIGDTGGTEEDNVNFSNTLSFISELSQLHGICILLRPNHTRLSPAFKYCIDGLLTYLHKNAAQNIIFVFTFARGSCYSMGKTRELLVDVLRPIEKEHFVTIPLHRDRIYCMDNEAFEKLCLIKKGGIRYSPKNMAYFSESWGQAERECQRMLEYVTKLEPHRIWETLSLNEARRTIMDLTHPLAMISQSIQAIGEGEETEPKLETVEFVPLTFPRTVCTSTRCTDVKTSGGGEIVLYKRRCHERCYLDGVVAESFPNESLKKCAAMGGGNICTVVECGCDWSVHMHIRYDQLVIERAIDESMLKMFADKRETLSKLEALRQQMLRERELIYSKAIAALFSSFLKTWALKPFNDGMEAYIKLSIKDAERLIDSRVPSPLQ